MENKITFWWFLKRLLIDLFSYIPDKINEIKTDIRGVSGDVHSPIGFNGAKEKENRKDGY